MTKPTMAQEVLDAFKADAEQIAALKQRTAELEIQRAELLKTLRQRDEYWSGLIAERDAALARAERAEQERDELRAEGWQDQGPAPTISV
jgi:hypothetical protein